MERVRIGLVGLGKIALDQHLPALAGDERFSLAAIASRNASLDAVPSFATIDEMLASGVALDAVSLCTPPRGRIDQALAAIDAGLHVMLEKPPAATVSEAMAVADHARARGVVLFATWHSREAAGVEPARLWLADRRIDAVRITWREDIRRWHPGQDWILEAGGFGVFDPGINALSIFSKIMPFPVFVESARLSFPANRQTPVDVEIAFKSGEANQPKLSAGFNWLETQGEIWTITIETGRGNQVKLEKGGTVLRVNGVVKVEKPSEEYEGIYERFAELLKKKKSDVDSAPLRLVADAFLLGARENVEPFEW